MKTLQYKGFEGSVEYSEEDHCYHGKVLNAENSLILYEGNSVEELENRFQTMIDDHIIICQEEKEDKKGQPQTPTL